jgi:hypothetical protein
MKFLIVLLVISWKQENHVSGAMQKIRNKFTLLPEFYKLSWFSDNLPQINATLLLIRAEDK